MFVTRGGGNSKVATSEAEIQWPCQGRITGRQHLLPWILRSVAERIDTDWPGSEENGSPRDEAASVTGIGAKRSGWVAIPDPAPRSWLIAVEVEPPHPRDRLARGANRKRHQRNATTSAWDASFALHPLVNAFGIHGAKLLCHVFAFGQRVLHYETLLRGIVRGALGSRPIASVDNSIIAERVPDHRQIGAADPSLQPADDRAGAQ